MTWISKISVFATLLVFSAPCFAQTIVFRTGTDHAEMTTRLLESKSELHSVRFQLSVPQVRFEPENDGFDSLFVPGLVPLDIPGDPQVYTTGRMIAVPQGFEPVLHIEEDRVEPILHTLPAPAQRRFRCGPSPEEGFAYNAELYASNDIYPKQKVALEEVGNLSGMRLVRIAVNPIQVDLKNRMVLVTTELSARVDFRRTDDSVAAPLAVSHLMAQLLHAIPANGEDLNSRFLDSKAKELLVVVVADQYTSAIQPYVAWKKHQGLQVEVVTYTQAGGSKEKVKAFLKTYYTTHATKPSYLLFVGNKTTLPTFMESTASGSAATDYTYALLNGDSNVPNVAYGRLAVDNLEDLTAQITRWIDYEKKPTAGASWYHDGTTIASAEGYNPSDRDYAEQVQAALKAGTYKNIDRFYNEDGTATFAKISMAINQGRSWLTYFGHGSGESWASTNDDFDVKSVAKLQNPAKLPIIIDVACQNASWVKKDRCFGKAWVTEKKGKDAIGAVAFYGGSVNVSWHPPAIMAVGVAKYHFQKKIPSLGGSVLAGQLYLIEQKGNKPSTMDNVKWYNLLGDPTLVMRTETPH